MCLIAAFVFGGLALTAAGKGDWGLALLYTAIAVAFIALMIRNIRRTHRERRPKKD